MTFAEMLAYFVAKGGPKGFAFLGSPGTDAPGVGVKCGKDRDAADEWLRRYPDDATKSSYIGRYGWNSLRMNGAIPDDELLEAVDASYDTGVRSLPRRDRPGQG